MLNHRAPLEASGSRIGFGSWIFSGAWCSWSLGGLNPVQAIPAYSGLLQPIETPPPPGDSTATEDGLMLSWIKLN